MGHTRMEKENQKKTIMENKPETAAEAGGGENSAGLPQAGVTEKSGYLMQAFRLFHLRDQVQRTFSPHYHDFYKVVIFIEGKVCYHVEGRAYELQPWDVLLVDRFAIHKPEIDASVPYERFIFWIRSDLEEQSLLACFDRTKRGGDELLRLKARQQQVVRRLLQQMEEEHKRMVKEDRPEKQGPKSDAQEEANPPEEGLWDRIMEDSLFQQLLVQLNRFFIARRTRPEEKVFSSDERVEDLLGYINRNLTGDLSVEALSRRMYMSRYYLMRLFKEGTGYTLHRYILNKRLILAQGLIDQGVPVVRAAHESGFGDYTSFVRAYRKQFGAAPTRRRAGRYEEFQPE